jgi:hypothetical protein
MAKGERKVQLENDIVDDYDSDSDNEYASPTYDELADLRQEYNQIIRKSKAKCDKLKDENEFLTAKYDIVVKASEEMKKIKLCHPPKMSSRPPLKMVKKNVKN